MTLWTLSIVNRVNSLTTTATLGDVILLRNELARQSGIWSFSLATYSRFPAVISRKGPLEPVTFGICRSTGVLCQWLRQLEMIYDEDVSDDLIYTENIGCECTGSCSDAFYCRCLQLSQERNYDPGSTKLRQLLRPINTCQWPVFECHGGCRCSQSRCTNRVVFNRKHDTSALSVCLAGDKGLGVLAARDLFQGEFVSVFTGNYLLPRNAHIVVNMQQMFMGHDFAMVVREFCGPDRHIVFETVVDGCGDATVSNTGDAPLLIMPSFCFINHSCHPNLTVIPVRHESVYPTLALFALRNIRADTELTYDYGEKANSPGGLFLRRCLCRSWNCRGFLPNRL
uniref:SET domain-containing protein n=1 Tax=Mesocestoides corti TaxID=53468 RepID=A0A5K3FH76_MESCO